VDKPRRPRYANVRTDRYSLSGRRKPVTDASRRLTGLKACPLRGRT